MNDPAKKLAFLAVFGLVIFGLYLSSLYNYNLFHILVELFSIIIGFSAFIITWDSRERLDNNTLLFLGIAYFSVSALDLIHTMAYKGMNIFAGYDANLPTQLWIASSYVKSISLLISPFFLTRKIKPGLVFLGHITITALLTAAIFAGIFPACYVEGTGLTPFKITSEYIIILILLIAGGILLRNRRIFARDVLVWLLASILLTASADLFFTLYFSVFSLSNLTGHILKLVGVFFFYKAIVEMALKKPHQLLFRNLTQSETNLRQALEEVQRLAITDPLTSLYNRRYFFEFGEQEFKSFRRYQHPLSAIMLDIDHFKQVNDRFGHQAGDQVLVEMKACFHAVTRESDVVARYGGEEFAILLPETSLQAAAQVAERLRVLIEQKVFNTPAGPVTISLSLGAAAADSSCASFEALLAKADQAMYAAKHAGRNRVVSD